MGKFVDCVGGALVAVHKVRDAKFFEYLAVASYIAFSLPLTATICLSASVSTFSAVGRLVCAVQYFVSPLHIMANFENMLSTPLVEHRKLAVKNDSKEFLEGNLWVHPAPRFKEAPKVGVPGCFAQLPGLRSSERVYPGELGV